MATRAELKNRAKACLKNYYWWAVLVCFLAGLLGGGSGSSLQIDFGGGAQFGTAIQQFEIDELDGNVLFTMMMIVGAILIIAAISFLIGVLWGTFVGNPIRVGSCAYFMESRDAMNSAGIGKLFWAFENRRYKNIVTVMFMRWLYTFLWSLLFIIPGIIKSYEYYMVPYILHDTPDLHYKDALAISKELMQGNKWRLFVLELSFIGWSILGSLCCGVGLFFLTPYVEATMAEFYVELRRPYMGGPQPCDDVV